MKIKFKTICSTSTPVLIRLFVLSAGMMLAAGLFFPDAFAQRVVSGPAVGTSALIVKLVNGLTADQQTAVVARNGGVERSSIQALRLRVVECSAAELPGILATYRSDPQVERVELNQTRKVEGAPQDARYGDQWSLPRIGWDSVFGSIMPSGQATVAVLDTGVDASHPELSGIIVDGTSILDGSNGMTDANGHGTEMAGIIAALPDAAGIVGVGFAGVRIMPVTVLDADGAGQDGDIIAGILYAVDHGADVILMSFSNPGFSQNLQDAIDYAWSSNVVLVAATGNDGSSSPTFPAGNRGVIGVTATDPLDNLADFSNYGQDTFLAAPGALILTTSVNNGYAPFNGTSASAAIVAGVAAFQKAVDPLQSNGVIVGRLARSADPAGTAGDPNSVLMFGNGRVNMAKALTDTGNDPVLPAGAAPVGNGGPYVGPYIAGNSPVSGRVTSSAAGNQPLAGVMVSCMAGCTGSYSAITDAAGHYAFSAVAGNKLTYSRNDGTLALAASKDGFVTQSITFAVANNTSYANKDFTLAPSVMHLAGHHGPAR